MTTAPVMTITEELLAELEEKAKAATPGPWEVAAQTVYALNDDGFNRFSALVQDARTSVIELYANATHIAAANPATVIALIAHIRSLEERLEVAEKNSDRYLFIASTCSVQLDGVEVEDESQIDAAIAQEGSHE